MEIFNSIWPVVVGCVLTAVGTYAGFIHGLRIKVAVLEQKIAMAESRLDRKSTQFDKLQQDLADIKADFAEVKTDLKNINRLLNSFKESKM